MHGVHRNSVCVESGWFMLLPQDNKAAANSNKGCFFLVYVCIHMYICI